MVVVGVGVVVIVVVVVVFCWWLKWRGLGRGAVGASYDLNEFQSLTGVPSLVQKVNRRL